MLVPARSGAGAAPPHLDRPTALGIGEVGLNKNSRNEITVFEEQVELPARRNKLLLIHTPHLEDKLKGTRIIDILKNGPRIAPERVLIDQVFYHNPKEFLSQCPKFSPA